MSRIAVFGGHGKVALHLNRILSEQGDEVSAIIRNPDHAAEVKESGATPVVADVEGLESDDIAKLLVGHDAVVWSAGAGGGNPERTYAVDRDAAIRSMDAAEVAGARRYVMLSYFGADPAHGVPESEPFFAYAEAKAAADTYLRESSLAWTVLGPSALTLEPASGTIEVASERVEGASVSRENVALVVAASLADESTIRRTIEFNDGDTEIAEALKP